MIEKKKCAGHNLYLKPQKISPLTKCLEKCNRIKTCGSVDFYGGKFCEPKNYRCSDDELENNEITRNFMRLRKILTKIFSNHHLFFI